METTTTAQGSFGDLALPFDPIFDPRWQNIYQPAHDASSFDWMHYRTPDDDLSSASSSSDGSYAHSIYSASSDLGNPLNYPLHAPPSVFPSPPYDPFAAASASAPTLAPQHQQHQHTASPPPTTTNAPSTTTSPAAWASMYTNPYQHDPYQQQQHQHHQSHQPSHAQGMAGQPLTGRDSGEWDSYSSGGEEPYPSYPVPHNPHLQQQHQQPPPNQQQGQNQGMYGAMNLVGDLSASSGGGGGAGPGGSYSQQHGGPGHPNNPNPNSGAGAKELYASPSPPSANNAYEYDYDSRRVAQQQQYSASPYPSPTTQPQAQGQGGSRLTPELSQLSIGQQGQGQVRYTPGPLSPASQLQQQQYAPASGSPGPSRTRASGHAQVPYGRPPGHRYAQQQVQHQHTISGSSGSAPSSSSSQGQGQVQYSPTGATAPSGGKIFGTATLPPLPSSNSLPSSNPIFPVSSNAKSIPPHQHQSQQQQLQQDQQERKPRKEMVAGTPTHPDIPRPANVAAPVPVPHLTKKSRGRQVPSVNSVHSVQSNQSQSQSVQSNSNRRSTGTGSNESRSRERNSYDESRSPLSPGAGGQMQNAGYFGHPSHPSHLQQQSQYSDDERDFHHAQAQIPHPHRSLFGQPIDEHGSYAAQGQGAGSASSMSSPATSLSSRRTAERERDARDELEHGSLPPLSSITGVPSSAAQPASNGAPTPGSLEAELRSRPFVCTVEGCGKAYIRAEHLKRHVRSIHTNDKPYECPHPGCGREFSRYDNLCQHFKGVHGPTSGSKNFPSA